MSDEHSESGDDEDAMSKLSLSAIQFKSYSYDDAVTAGYSFFDSGDIDQLGREQKRLSRSLVG